MLNYSVVGLSTRCAAHLPHHTYWRCWQHAVPFVHWLAYAPAGAPVAGLRYSLASFIGPDAAALSFRAGCKPLPAGRGEMSAQLDAAIA